MHDLPVLFQDACFAPLGD
jgi:RNA-directed DNA polymerase